MNILPKKRWHVRTRDNINRVRRDEAKAAEEEKEKERRIEVADREVRLQLLRSKANANRSDVAEPLLPSTSFEHVNFFKDLEEGETTKNSNEENQAEKKKDQEDWEKKMGILTYLGGERVDEAWWEKGREKIDETSIKDPSRKEAMDPLGDIRGYLRTSGVKRLATESSEEKNPVTSHKKKKKHRRHRSSSSSSPYTKKKKSKKSKKKKYHKRRRQRHSSSSSSDSFSSGNESKIAEKSKKKEMLDLLRLERLERENKERVRESRIKNGLSADPGPEEKTPAQEGPTRKYNSQFNPEFARQNKLNVKTKYWLE
ncbi:leukocyte receptor cluster member 1 homolog [Lepeophtheirus salmonis]|nr:leukocyte receptor cluster member 1 homolog [Lepeophtheirus salmonis]